MKYQHILWDYNGTLLNDVELCVEVINGMLHKRGLPLMTLQTYREMFDFPVKDYYARIGFDFRKESFEIVGTEFIVEYDKRQNTTKLHEGVVELLHQIKRNGVKQSVLSARKEEQLLEEMNRFGIHDCFDYITGLNDHYAGGKTEIGFNLIQKIGISKSKIVLIGDTMHDAEVAKEIGIDCILIANGHHTRDKLVTCGVPVYAKLSEIEKLILTNKP